MKNTKYFIKIGFFPVLTSEQALGQSMKKALQQSCRAFVLVGVRVRNYA